MSTLIGSYTDDESVKGFKDLKDSCFSFRLSFRYRLRYSFRYLLSSTESR